MTNINSSFGTVFKSAKKFEKTSTPTPTPAPAPAPAPASAPPKGNPDTFTGRYTNILDQGYQTGKSSGGGGFGGWVDNASQPGSVIDMTDPPGQTSADNAWIDNSGGLKNTRRVLKTDSQDTVKFQGANWKKTENVTDMESFKEHQKDPFKQVLTGNLYEDNNGNKFLVTGDGKQSIEPK